MIILIEIIVLGILFTTAVYIMSRNPIATLYNYPPKIVEKVKNMDIYKDKIPTKKNQIFAKSLASFIIIIIVSLIMKYINNYDNFIETFLNSYFIWTIINIYDVLVLDILWFCRSKKFVFEGTEDIINEYKNYWFHIKGGIIGQFIGLVLCILIGFVVTFVL